MGWRWLVRVDLESSTETWRGALPVLRLRSRSDATRTAWTPARLTAPSWCVRGRETPHQPRRAPACGPGPVSGSAGRVATRWCTPGGSGSKGRRRSRHTALARSVDRNRLAAPRRRRAGCPVTAWASEGTVSYTLLRAHETVLEL